VFCVKNPTKWHTGFFLSVKHLNILQYNVVSIYTDVILYVIVYDYIILKIWMDEW